VAYVSDAGTPGISDPGARLVSAAHAYGLRTMPLPGASSTTALLSVAGCTSDTGTTAGFVFQGFLSSKAAERALAIQSMQTQARAVVLLEAPHRIEALALALAALGERKVTVGRELTKQFETVLTLPAKAIAAWLAEDANRARGEFTLVVHGAPVAEAAGDGARVLKLLLPELPLKSAVKLAAEITGESRNTLYELALELKTG
jgi:16S rRNA (cytidine1402-2'-O)-methyltransferase